MSELLDERVVEMRFDNADFEHNVNQSIQTINKLKESLDFDNAGDSFENLSASAKSVDLSPIADSIDEISVKFNMLEMIAANVLSNIVNKAVDAGSRLVKSMTIDQVTSGWSKYEEKTKAVQTIMAATDKSIDEVNYHLERLSWFADETSYSFTDMVNNIGKFTSAGVELDKATDAMMGISNWAALSGAGVQQASRAMYNLSQAISMGYVGVTDWRSIELANMATLEFKETAIETALALGTITKTANGYKAVGGKVEFTAESMRNSLKEQWLTTDVLNATLEEYNEFANVVYEKQQLLSSQKGYEVSARETIKWLEAEGYAMDSLGAKAFVKAQEAKTFTEVLEATADAVSTGWMRTFEMIFGNYEQAKVLWSNLAEDMWEIFASPIDTQNSNLADVLYSNFQKFLGEIPDGTEFSDKLFEKFKEIGKSNGKTDKYLEELFARYDSLEDFIKTANIGSGDIEKAFAMIEQDYEKEYNASKKLISKLENQSDLLKTTIVNLAYGYYGKDPEDARKKLIDMGWTNIDSLETMAEAYKNGMISDWDAITKAFIQDLEAQKDKALEFKKILKNIDPLSGFYEGLQQFGGRDKLIGGFENLIGTFKNLFYFITNIKNAITDMAGGNTLLSKLIDGFNRLTTIFYHGSNYFELLSEGIYSFLNGGIQNKLKRFWKGYEVPKFEYDESDDGVVGEKITVMEHVPGLLDHIHDIFTNYISQFPKEIQKSIETINTNITNFIASIPQKIEDFKRWLLGDPVMFFDVAANGKELVGGLTYTGGLIDRFVQKIRSLGDGLGGKIIDGITSMLRKIGDYLVGYDKDGEHIEGHIQIIYDKITEFINNLKKIKNYVSEIIDKVKTFFFGKKINTETFGQGIYKESLFERIQKNPAYQAVRKFILGDEKSKEPNIFGRISNAITSITKSKAFDDIKTFFFGKKINTQSFGQGIYIEGIFERIQKNPAYQAVRKFILGDEKSKEPNIFGRISNAVTKIIQSSAYLAITKFLFGGEDKVKEPSIFGRISNAVTNIIQSPAYQAIHKFIFGGEDKTKEPSIFGRISGLITKIAESTAFKEIKTFFFGDGESKTSGFLNILNDIRKGFESIWNLPGFKAIHDFFFPKKKSSEPDSILHEASYNGSGVTHQADYNGKNNSLIVKDDQGKIIDNSNLTGFQKLLLSVQKTIEKVTSSKAFQDVKRFIFGSEKIPVYNDNFEVAFYKQDFPNIFARIKTHIDNFIETLKKVKTAIKEFLFGKEVEGLDKPVMGLFDKIQSKVVTFWNTVKPKLEEIKAKLHEFRRKLGLDWEIQIIDENGVPTEKLVRVPGFIDKISKKLKELKETDWFGKIEDFFIGKKIGSEWALDEVTDKYYEKTIRAKSGILKLKDAIVDFLLGPANEEGKRTENLFTRLPGYVKNVSKAIKTFFVGEQKLVKKTGSKNGIDYIYYDYEQEGGLVNKLKEKFEQLKTDHPWFAEFCKFIETQLKNIGQLFKDANGSITLAISNLNAYLNGGKITTIEKDSLGNVVESTKEVNGVITDIRENIKKIFNGGKEENQKKGLIGAIRELLGVEDASFVSRLNDVLRTIIAINLTLLSANFSLGDKLGFKIQSGLEVLIESIKELAESVFIIGATLAGLAVLVHFLGKDGYQTLRDATIILIGIFGLLTLFGFAFNNINISPKTALSLHIFSNALSTIGIVFGILLFVFTKYDITYSNKYFQTAAAVIGGFILLLTIFAAASTKVAKSGEKIKSASGTFIGIGVAFYAFGKMVATIVGSLLILYFITKDMKDLSGFKNAAIILGGAIAAAVAVLVAISIAVKSINKAGGGVTKGGFFSTALILFSVSSFITNFLIMLGAIAFIIKTFNVDRNSIEAAFGILIGVLTVTVVFIGALAFILNKTAEKILELDKNNKQSKIGKAIGALTAFIIIIGIFMHSMLRSVAVLAGVGKVSGWENLAVAFGGVVLLIMAIAGMTALLANIKISDKSALHTLEMAFGVIIFLGILTAALSILIAHNDLTNIHTDILPLTLALGEILILMAVTSSILSDLSKLDINKNSFIVIAKLMVAMAALALLANSAYTLVNDNKLFDIHTQILPLVLAIGEIAVLAEGLTLILGQLSKTPINFSGAASFVGIIGAIGLLSYAAIKLLSIVKEHSSEIGDAKTAWKTLVPLLEIIGEILLTTLPVVLMTSMLGHFNVGLEQVVSFGLLTAFVLGLAFAVTGLVQYVKEHRSEIGDIKTAWKTLIPLLEVIGEIILAVLPAALITSLLSHFKVDFKSVGVLVALTVFIIALGASLFAIIPFVKSHSSDIGDAQTAWQTLIPVLEIIGEVILAVTAALIPLALLKKIKPDWKLVGQFAVISGIIALLAAAVVGLSVIANKYPLQNWDSLLPYLVSIAGMVVILTVAVAAIGLLNKASKSGKLDLDFDFDFKKTAKLVLKVIGILAEIAVLFTLISGIFYVFNTIDGAPAWIIPSLKLFSEMIKSMGVIILALIGGILAFGFINKLVENKIISLDNFDFKKVAGFILKTALIIGEIVAVFAIIGGVFKLIDNILHKYAGTGKNPILDSVNYLSEMISSFSDGFLKLILVLGGFALILALIGGAIDGLKNKLGGGFKLNINLLSVSKLIWSTAIVIGEIILAIAALAGVMKIIDYVGTLFGAEEGWFWDFITDVILKIVDTIKQIVQSIKGESTNENEIDKPKNFIEKLEELIPALQSFLEAIRSLSLADLGQIAILAILMSGIFASEIFSKASEWVDSWGTDSDINDVISKLNDMAGVGGPLQEFLGSLSGLSLANFGQISMLSRIMTEIFKTTFMSKATEWVSTWNTGGNIDDVVTKLGEFAKIGNEAKSGGSLQTFLESIKDLKDTHKEKVSYLSSIMQEIFKATFMSQAASWLATWDTGGDIGDVVTKLSDFAKVGGPLLDFLNSLNGLEPAHVEHASYLQKILSSIFNTQLGSIGIKFTKWLADKTDYKAVFENFTREDGILAGIKIFAEGVNELVKNNVIMDSVSDASDAISSVFHLLSIIGDVGIFKEKSGAWEAFKSFFSSEDTSLKTVTDAIDKITLEILPKIQSLQEGLKSAGIDAEYIKNTVGIYVDLIQTILSLSELEGKNIDLSNFAQIGEYVVQGLVMSLESDGSTSAVYKAAYDLGISILQGLKAGLGVESPSKEAYALGEETITNLGDSVHVNSPSKDSYRIGRFIAVGLANGINESGALPFKMAQTLGEETIRSLNNGISQHAINMVTMDLLDENIFNMPDFKDEIGNIDFDRMRDFLHEKFDEVFDPSYIDSFVGSWAASVERIPETINDARSDIVRRINSGEFGLGQDAILEALEEELGSVDAARSAWDDYNNVLADNIKLSEDAAKQRKKNPSMTEQQYLEMIQDEQKKQQEAFDLFNSGELHKRAAENGTSLYEEVFKLGINPGAFFKNADRYYLQGTKWTDFSKEYSAAVFYTDEYKESVKQAKEETSKLKEETADLNKKTGELNKITEQTPVNVKWEGDNIEKRKAVTIEFGKQAKDTAKSEETISEAVEETTQSYTDQQKAIETVRNSIDSEVKKAESNLKSQCASYVKVVDKIMKNDEKLALGKTDLVKVTEEEAKAAFDLKEALFSSGLVKYEDLLTWGFSKEQADYVFGRFIYSGQKSFANKDYKTYSNDIDEYTKKVKKSADEIAEANQNSTDEQKKSTEEVTHYYENLDEETKKIVNDLTFSEKDGKGILSLDVSALAKNLIDTLPDNIKSGLKLAHIDLTDYLDFGTFEIPGIDLSLEGTKEILMSQEGRARFIHNLLGNDLASVDGLTSLFSLFSDLSNNKTGFINKVAKALNETLANVDDLENGLTDINNSKYGVNVDNSGIVTAIDYVHQYSQEVDKAIAGEAVRRLKSGIKMTEEQLQTLWNIWYNYRQGEYKAEELPGLFDGLTLGDLTNIVQDNGLYRDKSKYTNPYLKYAEEVQAKIAAGEKYTTEDLFKDIANGKWGTDQQRLEAFESINFDGKKINAGFTAWKNGIQLIQDFPEAYGQMTDAEKAEAEQREKLNQVLESTPQGAMRAAADFLKYAGEAITDKKSADNFVSYIDTVFTKLQNLTLSDASQFESIANFLKSISNITNGSSVIGEDFGALMTSLQDTLNNTTFDAEKFAPITDFFTQLNTAADSISNTIGPLTSMLADIVRISTSDVTAISNEAVTALMEAIIGILQTYYEKFKWIGFNFIAMLTAGMLSAAPLAKSAANGIATVIASSIESTLKSKADTIGQSFIAGIADSINAAGGITSMLMEALFGGKDSQLGEESGIAEGLQDTGNLEENPAKELGKQFVKDFFESSTKSEEAEKGIADFDEMIGQVFDLVDSGSVDLQTAMTGFAEGLSEGMQEAKGPVSRTSEELKGIITAIVPDGFGMGYAFCVGVAMGLIAGAPLIAQAAAQIGGFFGGGFSGGISSTNGSVISAAGNMAQGANNAVASGIQSASPSKVTMRYGRYFGEGFALGIDHEAGNVTQSARNMAGNVIDSLIQTTGVGEKDFYNMLCAYTDAVQVANKNISASFKYASSKIQEPDKKFEIKDDSGRIIKNEKKITKTSEKAAKAFNDFNNIYHEASDSESHPGISVVVNDLGKMESALQGAGDAAEKLNKQTQHNPFSDPSHIKDLNEYTNGFTDMDRAMFALQIGVDQLFDVFPDDSDSLDDLIYKTNHAARSLENFGEIAAEDAKAVDTLFDMVMDGDFGVLGDVNDPNSRDSLLAPYGWTWDMLNKFKKGANEEKTPNIVNPLQEFSKALKLINDPKFNLKDLAEDINKGLYGNWTDRKNKLISKGHNYEFIQDYINRWYAGENINWDKATEEYRKFMNGTVDNLSKGLDDYKDATFEDIVNGIINTNVFGTGNKEGTQRYDAITQLDKDFQYVQKYVNDKMAGNKINWDDVEKYYQTYLGVKEQALQGNEEFKKYYEDFLAGVNVNWEEAEKKLQNTSKDMENTMSQTEQTFADATNTKTDQLVKEASDIHIRPVVVLDTSEAEKQLEYLQNKYSTFSARTISASYNRNSSSKTDPASGGVNVNFNQTINSKSPVNAKTVGKAMSIIGKLKMQQQLAEPKSYGGVLAV